MALIKCKECGKQISDKAQECPHCGCPVEVDQARSNEIIEPATKKKRWPLVVFGLLAVGIVAAVALYNSEGGFSSLLGSDEAVGVVITPEFTEVVRKYDKLAAFSDGMAAVCKNGKWGYINHKGEEVIPCQFDSEGEYNQIMAAHIDENSCVSHAFHEGVALVRRNEEWGVIDKEGKVVVEYGKYDFLEDCHDGIICASNEDGESAVFFNKNGEKQFELDIDEYICSTFSDGLLPVRKEGKYGYVNVKGEVTIPCKYVYAAPFSEGKAIVRLEDVESGLRCIDKQGKELFRIQDDVCDIGEFHNGMLAVYTDDGGFASAYGFIDETGKLVIPCKYFGYFERRDISGVYPFSEGYTYLGKEGDQPHFVDKKGVASSFPYKLMVRPSNSVGVFSEGLACVENESGKVGFMDVNGKLTIPFKYGSYNGELGNLNTYGVFNNGVALVQMGDRWGYVDKNGNDTFTSEDAEAWEAKMKHEAEERRLQEQREREEAERLTREGPDWLQGTWRLETFDDYGRSIGYLYSVFNHGTVQTYANEQLVLENSYHCDGEMLIIAKGGSYRLDNSRQIVVGMDGKEMTKVSRVGEGLNNRSSVSNRSSSSSSARFAISSDVISYLSGKTFVGDGSRIKIHYDGVYVNGRCVSAAPTVERFESYKAIVRANLIPNGYVRFVVIPSEDKIVDQEGVTYVAR